MDYFFDQKSDENQTEYSQMNSIIEGKVIAVSMDITRNDTTRHKVEAKQIQPGVG